MITDSLSNPTVKAAIDALQKGDREAWPELFEPGAELYDDGEPRSLETLAWVQGERTPRRTSLDRLAAGLEARARALLTLAAELRTAARADDDREAA